MFKAQMACPDLILSDERDARSQLWPDCSISIGHGFKSSCWSFHYHELEISGRHRGEGKLMFVKFDN